MTALVRYEAARAALQAAHDVDEVKDIRDKAQAMAAYARQAQDNAMVLWASEIKVRAERRAGEMLAEMPKHNGGRPAKTGNSASPVSETLKDMGVSKRQSAQWQKVAAIPDEKFEKVVEEMKDAGLITTSAVLRTATKPKKVKERAPAEKKPPKEKQPKPSGDEKKARAELIDLQGKYADLLEKNVELADTAKELEDKLTAFETTELDEQQKLIAELQLKLRRKDAEIDRLRVQIRDANNKANDLIREVKRLQKKT